MQATNNIDNTTFLNKENDPQYLKTLKELKAFVEEHDEIMEKQGDLKDRMKELFKFLKEKGFKNKALKSSLKDRNSKLFDEGYEEFLENKNEYGELLDKVDGLIRKGV